MKDSKGHVEYDPVTKTVRWVGPDDVKLTFPEMGKAVDEVLIEFGPVEEVEITDKHGTMKGFTIGPKDAA